MKPAAFLLAALLTGCAATKPLTLEERFYQNAFYNEEIEEERALFRWEESIHAYIHGASSEDRRHVDRVLSQISSATGLSVEVVDSEDADLMVFFVTADEWQSVLDDQVKRRHEAGYFQPFEVACMAVPATSIEGQSFMFVFIPKFHPTGLRRKCIAQEIGHLTGLRYDAVGYSDTAFGDWAAADHLTDVDYKLLKILYDPRLRNGMTWEEAQPIVRQIISEGLGG
jgi:hypothetical protein